MNRIILVLFCGALLLGLSGCGPSVPPEDKLLDSYEKYIDDIIAEYEKVNAGDIDALRNIAPLGEKGSAIREKMGETVFNEEQQERLRKIEEKRRAYFK